MAENREDTVRGDIVTSWQGRATGTIDDGCLALGGISRPQFRRLVAGGAFRVFRTASNAPIRVTARELARYIVACEERNALPVNRALLRRAARAGDALEG